MSLTNSPLSPSKGGMRGIFDRGPDFTVSEPDAWCYDSGKVPRDAGLRNSLLVTICGRACPSVACKSRDSSVRKNAGLVLRGLLSPSSAISQGFDVPAQPPRAESSNVSENQHQHRALLPTPRYHTRSAVAKIKMYLYLSIHFWVGIGDNDSPGGVIARA